MPQPLVSVLMMTYNHGPYIAQAIESVLAQETRFPFDLIICDDASTDGAREIAMEYARKDPRIVLSLQEKNTRFTKNFMDGCALIRGKYLAFCEGDDYWTDTNKLEKQVGYLEEHPDFTVCAHRVQMLREQDKQPDSTPQFIYKDCSADEARIKDGIFYPDEAIGNYYFQTGSLVLRWRFREGFPHWFRKRMMFDHFMFMLHAVEGKIKYFDEVMSVWRRHESGYTWLQTQDKGLFFQKEGTDWIEMYKNMDNFFSYRFTSQIEERINLALRSMVSNSLETGNLDNLRWLTEVYHREFWRALKNKDLLDAWRMAKPDDPEFTPPWANKRQEELPPAENSDNDKEALSFNPLAIEEIPPCEGSVWNVWTKGHESGEFFNLRSALCAWLWQNNISTIWAPAYAPPELVNTLIKGQIDYQLYNTTFELMPEMGFTAKIKSGDAVLLVEYLGRPLPAEFQEIMKNRPDVHWLIDRGQSLSAHNYVGAEACFYSPAKLFGLPDGGIAVKIAEAASITSRGHEAQCRESEKILLASLENPVLDYGRQRLAWLKYKEEHQLSQEPMSRSTRLLLERIPWAETVAQRKANWKTLFAQLDEYCLWPIAEPDFAPFAFPFLCPENITCEIVHTMMERQGIGCRRMWYPLPVAKRQFPIEEELSRKLLLLPIDSRLKERNMRKIIHCVKNILDDQSLTSLRTIIF